MTRYLLTLTWTALLLATWPMGGELDEAPQLDGVAQVLMVRREER